MVQVEVGPRVFILSSNPTLPDSTRVALDTPPCNSQGSSEHYFKATNKIYPLHFRNEETNVQNGKGTSPRACSYGPLGPLHVQTFK